MLQLRSRPALSRLQCRCFSASSTTAMPSIPQSGLIVRDFISDSLYNTKYGYFNRPGIIYSSPPFAFKTLLGGGAYKKQVAMLYAENPGSWLTPVELFKPHYAHAIAQWILLTRFAAGHPADAPLEIIEFGGGSGACALDILDHLQWAYADIYKRTTYTIVELSSRLAAEQRKRIGRRHSSARYRTVEASAVDFLRRARTESEAFIIGLEVLDNMPHDKVVVHPSTGEVYEVWVVPSATAPPPAHSVPGYTPTENAGFVEQLRPLNDPIVKRAWAHYEAVQKQTPPEVGLSGVIQNVRSLFKRKVVPVYLPTVCLKMLDMIRKCVPNHHALFADFHSLPAADVIEGQLSPIVASKSGAADTDHQTYVVPLGCADIFFPTDFSLLARAYAVDAVGAPPPPPKRVPTIAELNGEVAPPEMPLICCETMFQRDFLMRFSRDPRRTETRNGDNPMLDDYSNMSVLITRPARGRKGHATPAASTMPPSAAEKEL